MIGTAMRGSGRGTALLAAGLGLGLAGRQLVGRLREADLSGQVALITGGSRGLGLALARELAANGCRIAICARDGAELDQARRDLLGRGAEVLAVPCDVADRAQVAAMVEAVIARFGRIDLLINNAGIITVAPLEALTHEDFERVMAIDFWGVLNPTLAVLPHMRRQGRGRIATVTSLGGKVGVPHMLPYTCAKFAAVGLSEGLRAELADAGITVTTVVPGEMQTGSHLHAEFGGNQEAEYRWFALGASAPMTMRADRAARLVVRGIKRGTAELTYPISAVLATRLNGLAPNLAARVFALMDRALPAATSDTPGTTPGAAVQARIDAPLLDKATVLGRDAAGEFNQQPAASPPSQTVGAGG